MAASIVIGLTAPSGLTDKPPSSLNVILKEVISGSENLG